MLLVALNYNFECDWFVELSDSKLSDNKRSDNKLSDNNVASELVGNRSFLNQSQLRKLQFLSLSGKLLEYHGNFDLFIIHFPGLEAHIQFEFIFR